MRVIAGSAKGRHLLAVPGPGTRPITDRVKEALFSMLGDDVVEASFLDLFAGTGSVGIEALSRGAEQAVFIDRARKAIDILRKNLALTGFSERAQVFCGDSFRYLRSFAGRQFDLIYVAPPQYQDLWAQALLALDESSLLAPNGRIIVQIHPKEFHELVLHSLHLTRERQYGSTLLLFYETDESPAEA